MHDEGPAPNRTGPDATSSPRSSPKVTSSDDTVSPAAAVTRHRLRDARGDCLDVELPDQFDERAAACVMVAVGRCVHLIASADCRWTPRAVQVLSWRVAGRVAVLDDLPAALADELAGRILDHLDWLTSGVAA